MQQGLNPAEVPITSALNHYAALAEAAETDESGSQWWEDD